MQWILRDMEANVELAHVLERLGARYSVHTVVPIIGVVLDPPSIDDPSKVVLFGAYSMRFFADERGLTPGVFPLRPFVNETVWEPFLLNSKARSTFLPARDVPARYGVDSAVYFVRPVEDSKNISGGVRTAGEIVDIVEKMMTLKPEEIAEGMFGRDTMLMVTRAVSISKEWRFWAVGGRVVTYSLYKEGSRVVYRNEADDDALAFAQRMVDLNPGYSDAYVIDVCRTDDGLRLLETNSIGSAGYYAADLMKLAAAVEEL